MKKINFPLLIICLIIPFIAAGIGSFYTTPSIPIWYASLQKPSFSPPNWIFGPVWTFLYLLMGISLYFVWNNKTEKKYKKIGLILFFIQLFLNTLWSIIFFGLKFPQFAFIEIIFLWGSILFTIIYFNKILKLAGWLLIPYILWVSFASVLNYFIVIIN